MARAEAARGSVVIGDRRCVVTLADGARCAAAVEPGAPLQLCAEHLLLAYDWVARDEVKIGTSANPRLRLASIPHDEVLAFERGGRALEQRRHVQFAAHRFPRTEWFALHDELAAHVAELRAGVDDPWAEYERWLSRRLGVDQ